MREIISRLAPQDVIALGIGLGLFVVIALAWMLSALAAGFYAKRLNRSAVFLYIRQKSQSNGRGGRRISWHCHEIGPSGSPVFAPDIDPTPRYYVRY